MAPTAPQPSKTITPQGTGFSQIQTRLGGGESGGQAMSVLLNWHEKVCCVCLLYFASGLQEISLYISLGIDFRNDKY